MLIIKAVNVLVFAACDGHESPAHHLHLLPDCQTHLTVKAAQHKLVWMSGHLAMLEMCFFFMWVNKCQDMSGWESRKKVLVRLCTGEVSSHGLHLNWCCSSTVGCLFSTTSTSSTRLTTHYWFFIFQVGNRTMCSLVFSCLQQDDRQGPSFNRGVGRFVWLCCDAQLHGYAITAVGKQSTCYQKWVKSSLAGSVQWKNADH